MPSNNYNNNGGGRSGRGRHRGSRGGRGRGGGGEKRQPRTEPPPPTVAKESPVDDAGEDEDQTCVLCAHEVEIYALGKCDHPVCYRCSMKIRLLCEENTCPVCRTELNKIILSSVLKPFKQLQSEGRLTRERKKDAGFFFCNDVVGDKFYEILEFRCPKCPDRLPDITFEETKAHLRKEHQLQYCEICIKHNKHFPLEYKCYNRQDLATHKRKGDEDDTSHRGHPMCDSCQTRFLDKDALFVHLRRDHFFCHICDSISDTNQELRGKMNFYDSYNELNEHYREAHYLCQEGECATAQYTNVFSSKIDFQAHVVSKHGGGRTRAQQRMDRQIDINLQYSHRPSSSSMGGGFHRDNHRESDRGFSGRRGGGRGSRGGGRGDRGRGRYREPRNAVGAFEREGEHDLQTARALQASRQEQEVRTAKEEADAHEAALTRSILEDAESFPTLAVTTSNSTSSIQPSTSSMPGASVPDVIKQSKATEKPKEKATPAAASSSKASRNTGTGLISKWNQTPLNQSSLDTDFPALSNPGAPKPFLTPQVPASSVVRQDNSKKVPQKKGNNIAAHLRPPKPDEFPSLGGNGNYDPKKSLAAAPQWKKVKGGKSGMSASAQRIFAHQKNSFAALSSNSTNGGGSKASIPTASKGVVSGKAGNVKSKKKRRDDDDDEDVGGYTMLSRKLISQESYQPKVEANVKLIAAKPETAIEKPPQNPREFSDSPFDFPSLGAVSGAVAPPPGFGPSAPRYKSPFGGATTTSGSNGRGSKVVKPPPGFSSLTATAAPITTVELTSSEEEEVVKPAPAAPVSSDFPPLAPGAPAFTGLPTSSRSRRNRSRGAPAPSASRWGGASSDGGSAQQGPSLVESLRNVNIGSGKGKLNLGNMFDYEI